MKPFTSQADPAAETFSLPSTPNHAQLEPTDTSMDYSPPKTEDMDCNLQQAIWLKNSRTTAAGMEERRQHSALLSTLQLVPALTGHLDVPVEPPQTTPQVAKETASAKPLQTIPLVAKETAPVQPSQTTSQVATQAASAKPPQTIPLVDKQTASAKPPQTIPLVAEQTASAKPPQTTTQVATQAAPAKPPQTTSQATQTSPVKPTQTNAQVAKTVPLVAKQTAPVNSEKPPKPEPKQLQLMPSNLDTSSVFELHKTFGDRMEEDIRIWSNFKRVRAQHRTLHVRVNEYMEPAALAQLAYQLGHIGRHVMNLHLIYTGLTEQNSLNEFNKLFEQSDWNMLGCLFITQSTGNFDFQLPSMKNIRYLHFTACIFQPHWNALIEANTDRLRQLAFQSTSQMDRVKSYPARLRLLQLSSCTGLSAEDLYEYREIFKLRFYRRPVLLFSGYDFVESHYKTYSNTEIKELLFCIFRGVVKIPPSLPAVQ